MDISSIGGNGPYRSHSAAYQNASPAGVGATSSEAVNEANRAEVAAEKPLPVLGAPDVAQDEENRQTSEPDRRKGDLSQEEKGVVDQLKRIDREVRAREQAHLSAAGPYASGGASFQAATGPDGNAYAVSGEVGIDAGSEKSAEATIRKMQVVQAAALAPADPSAQDRAVAGAAGAAESAARLQIMKQQEVESVGKAERGAEASKAASEATEAPAPRKAGPIPEAPLPLGRGGPPEPTPASEPLQKESAPPIDLPGVVPPGSGDRVQFEALPVLGQGEPLPEKGQSVAERIQERSNVSPHTTDKTLTPTELAATAYERGAQVDGSPSVKLVG
jgi:hypothetical protein